MAGVASRGLLGLFVASMATGLTVGCGSDACALSCEEPHARVLTRSLSDPLLMEMCLDDECESLDDRREQYSQGHGEFSGFFSSIPGSGQTVRVRVEVRDLSGAVLATFDEVEVVPDGTCCPYLAVEFDGDELTWVDV